MNGSLHSRLLLGPTVLCDVISAVVEFMIKVSHGCSLEVSRLVANTMPLGSP